MGSSQNNNYVIKARTRDSQPINLRKSVKSRIIIKTILSNLDNDQKLKLFIYNKEYQKLIGVDFNIEYIKKKSGRYIIGERNGKGNEYSLISNRMLFSGNYLNGKRNGKGKEFDSYGRVEFQGEYLNGRKLKGKVYDREGNIAWELEKSGKGKEYFYNGKIRFEGEYLNGIR